MSKNIDENWIKEYLDLYKDPLFDKSVYSMLIKLKNDLENIQLNGKKTMIMGNGGSAAIASHVAVDFSKNAKIRMVNFNEADLITCLANDYGYEHWMSKAVEIYGDKDDLIILISSSGSSSNVINAAKKAKELNCKIVTFSGFSPDNPLKKAGDLNFWVESRAYNVVEMIHHIWLLSVCDAIIGKAEYPAN